MNPNHIQPFSQCCMLLSSVSRLDSKAQNIVANSAFLHCCQLEKVPVERLRQPAKQSILVWSLISNAGLQDREVILIETQYYRYILFFFSWKVIVLNLILTLRLIIFNMDPNLTFYHSTVASTTCKKKIKATRAWNMSISAIHFRDITGGQCVWTTKGNSLVLEELSFPENFWYT